MAIDITGLQEYITLHPRLLQTKVWEDTILKKIPVQEYPNTTPGKHIARIFTPIANLSECCSIPTGNSNIVDKELSAICIEDGQEYCEVDLAAILRNEDFRFTAGQESTGSLAQQIIDGQLAAFTEAIDNLVFQGDVTSSDPNLNKLDGLIKQANDSTLTQKLTFADEDVYTMLQRIAISSNINARKMGKIAIFVGREVADALQLQLINRNLFQYNPGTYSYESDIDLLGFAGFTIVPTRGLDGTNTIIATPFSNIAWLYSRRDDVNTLDWDYEKYHQKYYWRIKTILGIGYAIDEFVTIATFDEAVLTNPYCPCTTTVEPAPGV